MAEEKGMGAVTRRECMTGVTAATLLGASSAEGQAKLDTRLSGPPGHRRDAPAFRPIDFDK